MMMTKRMPSKPKSLTKANSLGSLRAALQKRTKEELVGLVLQWARSSRTTRQELELRFDAKVSTRELVAQTRQAIADATDFDDRQINYNSDYDYKAYETIARNFKLLIKAEQLAHAMELGL
jgi:hypothetical protein